MYLNLIKHTTTSEFYLIDNYSEIDWLNWTLIIISLLLIIISRVSDYNYIPNMFRKNYSNNSVTLKKLSSITLLINYYLIVSLFIWQYIIITNNNLFTAPILLLFVFLGVIILSNLKFLVMFFINTLFKQRTHFHIKIHISYYQVTGLILTPLYILSYFLSYFLEPPYNKLEMFLNHSISKLDVYLMCGIIIVLIIVVREIKSLFTALKNRIPLFYIILYLCTLEILPLILVIKILKG